MGTSIGETEKSTRRNALSVPVHECECECTGTFITSPLWRAEGELEHGAMSGVNVNTGGDLQDKMQTQDTGPRPRGRRNARHRLTH